MSTVDQAGEVVAGVDTHKATPAVVVLNAVGAVLQELTIPATAEGYQAALNAVRPWGRVVWGVEGAGSYGRAFVDALLAAGAAVYEVPGTFTKRHRQHASRHGKSDLFDARAVAEAVLRERDRLPACTVTDREDAVRLLYDRRDRLVRQRTEAVNRLRSTALHLDLRDVPVRLTTMKGLGQLRRRLSGFRDGGSRAAVLADEMAELVDDVQRLNARITAIEQRLGPLVKPLAPELLALYGVSTVVAAGIIGHAGGLRRCRDANAFAMRAGVAPIASASGRSSAVRLNTGGNRQLNRCLHVIAIAQVRSPSHHDHVYYERKRTEGKTHRAALRALKRQLATVVFYRLKHAGAQGEAMPRVRSVAA
jgi:transposase